MEIIARRAFITTGLAGVPGVMLLQPGGTARRNPGDDRFLGAIGRELAAQARAAQTGTPPREIARSFTSTLRLHAAYLRENGGDETLRTLVRDAKASGHWRHILDDVGNPRARDRSAAELEKRFAVDVRQLSPQPSRQLTRDDAERFAQAVLGGVTMSAQIEKLADALDDASARLPGVMHAAWEQSYDEWCATTICNVIWFLELAWSAACSVAFFLGEAGAIACLVAFIEYEQARFFAWLIGCNC